MAKLVILLVFLVALASMSLNFFLFGKQKEENRVVQVVDGDTFQTAGGRRVRLMGVDSPEISRCGAKEAKERLAELIGNKIVRLKEPVTESYGRTMALVYVDGKPVNEIMMDEGWGRPDYRKNSQREVLTTAYREARNKKVGLWSLCINPNPPDSPNLPNRPCLIKGNIDPASYDKFYHLQSCRHYDEIVLNTAFGDGWFCSEDEAKKAGFIKGAGCDQ